MLTLTRGERRETGGFQKGKGKGFRRGKGRGNRAKVVEGRVEARGRGIF